KEIIENTFMYLKSKVEPSWYPSVVLERRHKKQTFVDARSKKLNEELTQGVNIRVFDGQTLVEEATDNIEVNHLKQLVDRLVNRISSSSFSSRKEFYVPTWKDRLSMPLEEEILRQIPQNPTSDQWVHFGVPQRQELQKSEKALMDEASSVYRQIKEFQSTLEDSHKGKNPDFIGTRVSVEELDFLFIDSETRLSQTFYRNGIYCILMKGSNRSYVLQGGLGGQEAISLPEHKMGELYEDLAKSMTAEKIKPGRYKLLMAPSITGVFAHEAFGHSQEGDTWARGRSKAKELFDSQEKVGNEHATILNNPAIYVNGEESFPAWGSYYFDEEGWLAREQYLVKEGVLQSPMTNFTSAYRLNVPRSANGKRENWSHAIYTRQTNTYFSPGELTYNELISKVDYGFLARHAAGGMEDPKGMGIQVGMSYVEEIVNGNLTGKIFKAPNGGDIQLTGYVPDYLNSILGKTKIEAFSDEVDEASHPWNEMGGCGKYHKEIVAAGCGGPYVLIDNALLG
ncbi:MAG: TldD/PmbA family protein, partial [Bdellovibrionales bacterium]|nr:TldD/PmbA family protein [Bdellovibrionales bacterium]